MLLELQRDLALALVRCDDPQDCIETVLVHALRLPVFDCGGAYFFEEDTGMLRLIAHRALSPEFVAKVSTLAPDSPQVRQVKTGLLFSGAADELHPAIGAGLAREGLQAVVVMPLVCAGRLIGALNLASRSAPVIPSDAGATVERIAEFVGTLLDAIQAQRNRLEALVAERTRELGAANERLAIQAENLDLALDASEAGLREVDLLTGEIRWDDRGRSLAGYEDCDGPISLEQVLRERVHPISRDDLARFLEEIRQPSGLTRWEHEFMINHPTRGLRWLGGRGKVFRDETGKAVRLFGLIQDITERKHAEELLRDWSRTLEAQVVARTQELRDSENRFRVMAEATFEGIVISSDGIVIDVNNQAAAMFGYQPAEVIGQPTAAFVAPDSGGNLQHDFLTNPTQPLAWNGLVKDGSIIPVASRTRLEQRDGREIRLTAIRDLTAEKQSQARLENMRKELDRASGLALISEISQSIIHQLSQPLTVVGSHLEVVLCRMERCGTGDCKTGPLIDSMKAELKQMMDIMVHLRSLADPAQILLAPTSLNQMVEELLPLLLRESDAAGVTLRIGLEAGLPEVPANATQLKQVLINLVRNAIEACASAPPLDGGGIWISTGSLPGEKLELTVRDNGPGFAPGIAELLFAPFVTSKPEGTGIGLRLCQRIIKAHRGTIEGSPNPDGTGVSFRIRLPLSDDRYYTKV